jgi:hypothetical protein
MTNIKSNDHSILELLGDCWTEKQVIEIVTFFGSNLLCNVSVYGEVAFSLDSIGLNNLSDIFTLVADSFEKRILVREFDKTHDMSDFWVFCLKVLEIESDCIFL